MPTRFQSRFQRQPLQGVRRMTNQPLEKDGYSPKQDFSECAPTSTLIVGHGYLGKRVAKLALAQGHPVWASSRRRDGLTAVALSGAQPMQIDVTDRRTLQNLPKVQRVLVSVAFDPKSKQDRDQVHVVGLRNLLDALQHSSSGGSLPHVCLISTTGVYHQSGNVWVDERSPARPTRDGGKSHLRGESLLRRAWPTNRQTTLRLAGIYGPGRMPRLSDIIAGRPIPAEPDSYLNLIHVDDGAACVMAAWDRGASGLYCISDGHPMLRRTYYEHLARSVNVRHVHFVAPSDNANDRARSESSKRIDNRKMRRELLSQLKFPTCLTVPQRDPQ
jgi:nucleoside-diphosphate-sugar epimerase